MADDFTRQLAVLVDDLRSPKARSRMLAEVAREAIAEAKMDNELALGRTIADPVVTVDGRKGAAIASVRPDGRIVAEFNIETNAVRWILRQLEQASPVRSGRYQRSHVLFADNVQVDLPEGAEVPLPPAREYAILNVQPYARKIERGQSRQAPQGVYEAVAAVADHRFGLEADIFMTFRSPVLGYVAGGKNRRERAEFKRNRARTSAQNMERASRVPAIVVRPR